MTRVGVVGVGAMGMGVAKALLAKGLPVHVRDLVAAREAEAAAAGARRSPTPAMLAREADVAITLVVDATQTREVLLGAEGVVHGAHPDLAVMMCSTIAPAESEALARELAGHGIEMLDAPISGGPARAHAGTLSVMASGSEAAFAHCRAVLDAMSARCFRIGAHAGDGSRMKLVNNMLAAANLAAGCEAIAFAGKLGLDPRQAFEVVNASSGASWIFADRMARALQGDYAPRAAARVLKKDVTLFVDLAKELGCATPMAECARAVFEDTVARGFGEEDDAAVLKRYAALWA